MYYTGQLMAPLLCLQVKSVRLAEGNNTAVDHPLLDKARAFSSTPNAAASFFSAILHPSPTKRLTSAQALQHPYLRRCVQQMQASYCTSRQTKLGAALTIPISDSPPLVELAHTHGRGFLSTLVSVPSSGLKMMKSLVGHALPGGSSRGRTAYLIDAARYFPKYVHASSDAELSTQLSPQLSLERQSREPPSELSPEPQPGVGQLMAGINELRTDFSLRPAIAGAFNPTTAMLQAPQTSKHAKASIDRGFAAAALQMPRQRYPASPLSAASPQCLLHDEQPQLGPVKRTDSQDASSGLIPAIHSVRAQPANPCDGLSDVAAGKQQHVVTPADEAAGARQTPVVSDPRPHSEPGSTQAGPSKQRLVQAQQSSADKHAAADAASTTQLCNPVLEAAKAVEDGLQSAQVPVVPAFSHQVQVIEQEQSGAPDIPQAEQSPKAEQSLQAEQSSRLFAAVAVHAAGNCSNRTSGDGNAGSAPAGQLVRQKLLSSHPIDVLSETEDDLGGAQPIEPLQSPLLETIAQAHPQPLNQHSSTSKHAEDVAVGLCVKPLKSHILHYCPVKDQDLDLIDTHVEEGTGAGSICNGIGVEHAANAPAYFSSQSPYLSADVPAAQAQTRSVPLYRSVATPPITC